MRITPIIAVSNTFALCLAASGTALAAAAPIQDTASNGATPQAAHAMKPHYAAVAKGRNVNVRTAASVEGGYPFFQVNEGDIVQVMHERFGWSRIRTSTPVFQKAYGYVLAEALRVDDAAPKTATVTRRTTLNAPNLMQEGRPNASWEGLDPALTPGMKIHLLEKVPANSPDEPVRWKVRMPVTQEAWINSVWLRTATEQEIAAIMPKMPKTPVVAQASKENTTTTTTPSTNEPTAEVEQTEIAVVATTEDAGTTEGADEPTETEEPALTPAEERAAKLAALDNAFRVMLKERIESAELELLQQQFMQFSQREDATDLEKDTAQARAQVLELKIEVQDQLKRLKQMRERTQVDSENISATRLAMDARAPYDVVGQLNASIVFSGNGTMPLLFRLQDPSGGQTIAYLMPDDRYDIAAMTGLLVGIVGTNNYDETLQLTLVKPRRIDLLGPQQRTTPPTSTDPKVKPADPAVAEAETSGDETE